MSNKQRIATFSQQPSHVEWKAAELLTPSMEMHLARAAAELHEASERAALEKMRDASVAKFKEELGNAMRVKKASVVG